MVDSVFFDFRIILLRLLSHAIPLLADRMTFQKCKMRQQWLLSVIDVSPFDNCDSLRWEVSTDVKRAGCKKYHLIASLDAL